MYRPAAWLLAVATICAGSVPAAAEGYRANYSVTLLGLPVAKARFDSTFSKNRFAIEGSLSSAGIARLFDRTEGTTSVEGLVHDEGARPRTFRMNYVSGKKKGTTTIHFAGNNVKSAVNVPTPKKRGPNWIPVPAKQLQAALDPLSATLVRTADPAKVCNRTVRVFDGEMRADLEMSHRSTGEIRGFRGEAVTCDARFVPVAGYRKGREQIEFLKNRSRISISFMKLGETGFYTPVDATVGTQVGPLRVRLDRIEAL